MFCFLFLTFTFNFFYPLLESFEQSDFILKKKFLFSYPIQFLFSVAFHLFLVIRFVTENCNSLLFSREKTIISNGMLKWNQCRDIPIDEFIIHSSLFPHNLFIFTCHQQCLFEYIDVVVIVVFFILAICFSCFCLFLPIVFHYLYIVNIFTEHGCQYNRYDGFDSINHRSNQYNLSYRMGH